MEIKRPQSKQPMPDNAKLVFKGMLFDTYQWEVDAYDGSKKVFEKLKRPDTVLILPVTKEGQIILAIQEQPNKAPSLGTVGGRVDEGEDILEAAKRELLEETGYEATDWTLYNSVQPVSKIEWAIYTFIAKGCKKVAEQDLDGAEKIDLKFMSVDEFVDVAVNDDKFDDEIKIKIMEAKLIPEKMAEFKKLLIN